MHKHPLSSRLTSLRNARNLKQVDVAAHFGMSEGSYRHYESGRSVPSALQLEKLAEYFGVSTDYLLGRDDPTLSPDRQKLSDLAKTLSDEQVGQVLDLLSAARITK